VDYSPTEAEIKTCYQKGRFHAKSYHPHPEKQNEPVSKKKV
jgi:DnaJ-class molecular chaperone